MAFFRMCINTYRVSYPLFYCVFGSFLTLKGYVIRVFFIVFVTPRVTPRVTAIFFN